MTDHALPFLTPLALSLPATTPFVGAEAMERAAGKPFVARIGANESVFGPSPRAVAAMAEAAADVWMYGDSEAFELRAALAAHHGVAPAAIQVGEGVDGLLGLAARLVVAPGVEAVAPEGGYPTFSYHVVGYGGAMRRPPYAADQPDLEAMVAAARAPGVRVVYLANPDNPMGGLWDAASVSAFLDALPEDRLVLLDEAYAECAPRGALLPLDPEARPNLLRFRSFSKAYGLAGLRLGYAVGPAALIALFDRVRNHFGVGRLVQAAGLAALADQAHLARVQADIAAARDRIGAIGRAHGLTPLPSATNFVALDCGGGGTFAKATLDGLLNRGVFVRMPGAAPLNRCIRVSCGLGADLDAFEEALGPALAAARTATV